MLKELRSLLKTNMELRKAGIKPGFSLCFQCSWVPHFIWYELFRASLKSFRFTLIAKRWADTSRARHWEFVGKESQNDAQWDLRVHLGS
jgi:hypothetical protein